MARHSAKKYLWKIISKSIQVKTIFRVTIVLSLALASANAQQPLRTWGDNQYGKLGDGTATGTFNPTLIGTADWIAIAGGDFFSAGIQERRIALDLGQSG